MSATQRVIIAVSRAGSQLALRLAAALDATALVPARFAAELKAEASFSDSALLELRRRWDHAQAIVLIMASGIALRAVAPLLGDKQHDPALVCLDDQGRFVIPLLGGHQAGANALAQRIAALTGGQAVVSTASDGQGLPALDQLGREQGWRIDPESALTHVMACLVNGDLIGLYVDPALPEARRQAQEWLGDCANIVLLPALDALDARFAAAIIVSQHRLDAPWQRLRTTSLRYLPPALVVGMGCRRGVPADELRAAFEATLADAELHPGCVAALATAQLKAAEPGLRELAAQLNLALEVVADEQLAALDPSGFSPSAATARFDLPGVAEPSALLVAGPAARLLVAKRAFARCTVAVALRAGPVPAAEGGRLTLVGIGPGDLRQLTAAARQALEQAEVVSGYQVYIDQVRPLLAAGQELIVTPAMGDEVGRAQQAIALAAAGRRVALISSGDIGIYAMAGPVFEQLRAADWPGHGPVVEVLPGISAFQAAAARLGAPISHDLCLISLSDLLTPWEVIERRLQAAAEGDFVVALYNPRSRQRHWQLERALAILRQQRPPETPAAVLRNVSRPDETITLTNIEALDPAQVDMFTLLLIGNSQSYVVGGRMATPRGYARRDVGEMAAPPVLETPSASEVQGDLPLVLTGMNHTEALVVGGGPVGERKARALLAAGARLRLVSPEATPQLQAWAEQGRISWARRPYEAADLAGARLVFAATNQRAVNTQVAADAAGLGLLCNVADDPAAGNFHMPAVHRGAGLSVAVSTGGNDPGRAAATRDAIAAWLAGTRADHER